MFARPGPPMSLIVERIAVEWTRVEQYQCNAGQRGTDSRRVGLLTAPHCLWDRVVAVDRWRHCIICIVHRRCWPTRGFDQRVGGLV